MHIEMYVFISKTNTKVKVKIDFKVFKIPSIIKHCKDKEIHDWTHY